MRRKRLLTILASTSAAVVVGAAPASAQLGGAVDDLTGAVDDLADDLGATLDSAGCYVVDRDADARELLALDDTLCVTVEEVAETTKDTTKGTTKGTTGTVEETTETVERTVDEAAGGSSDGPSGGSDDGSSGGSDGGSGDADAGGGSSAPSGGEQTTGGGSAQEVAEVRQQLSSDADRERRLAVLRALRSDLSAGTLRADTGMLGPVGAGVADLDGSPVGSLAAPEVADGEFRPAGGEGTSPEVAEPNDDAILATSGPLEQPEVPLALQLLAATLVLGSGAVWTLARREYGGRSIFPSF